MLKERQKTILGAAIQRYVLTTKPVASEEIIRELNMDISPATVRNEMLQLDGFGFLEQPHTSAGRIPTDKGYRFFVDNLLSEDRLSLKELEILDELFKIKEEDDFIKKFSRTIAQLSNTFTGVGIFEKTLFYESGFSEILDEPEFSDPNNIKVFGQFADLLEEETRNMFDDFEIIERHIFIGKENPLKEARLYTMFLVPWFHPEGFSGFLTMVGPKRMNYSKNISFVRYLEKHK